MDLFTGKLGEWRVYRVEFVEPVDHTRFMCRRVHLRCEATDRVCKPCVSDFMADRRYLAIGNVVKLKTEPSDG